MAREGQVPDHCLVGEPTSAARLGDTIKIGRRGSLMLHRRRQRQAGPFAYPHQADNPIPKLVRLLDRLVGGTARRRQRAFRALDTWSITSVDVGNPASNVIPARATAQLQHPLQRRDMHADSLVGWLQDEMPLPSRPETGGSFETLRSRSATLRS